MINLIQFDDESEGIKIVWNQHELCSHSCKEPWISVGKGFASYDMHHGNFNIEDDLVEKVPLPYFEIKREEAHVQVKFYQDDARYIIIDLLDEGNRLYMHFHPSDPDYNRLWLRLPAKKEEKIYGCGEQFSHFNLRGNKYPLWVSEQGVGRNKQTLTTFYADAKDRSGGDYYTTYFPQPTFLSSLKYYCHIKEYSYMTFDFRQSKYHQLEIWNMPEELVFGKEATFVDLLKNLTDLLGRQPELPDWVYNGVILGMQGGTKTVLQKLNAAVDKGLKVSAIWAQDWEGKRITAFGKQLMWNWQWDKNLYPGLDKEIKELKSRGIRFMGYINPFLAIEGELYKEASRKGYCVKNKDGKDYLVVITTFPAAMVDLTNPAAYKWMKKIIKENMIDFGLSGWMADFGEYLPTDAVLYSGEAGEVMHNRWPVLWAKVNREAVEEAGKLGEVFFFTRAGYAGTSNYTTMMWAGDQNVDWSMDDGLPSVITAALSLGMSGLGLHHSDIGGYTTFQEMDLTRTKELFMRWAEMGAFAPIMRTHEGNRPDQNWQFDSDEETLLHYAKMSRIYHHLSPYIKACVKENALYGIPVIRPLFLHYEEDQQVYDNLYQFLLGRDLLVAPVYESGAVKRKVYLPTEDRWIHVWTEKEFSGGEVEIEAPIGYPPLFYRKQSEYSKIFKEVKRL